MQNPLILSQAGTFVLCLFPLKFIINSLSPNSFSLVIIIWLVLFACRLRR